MVSISKPVNRLLPFLLGGIAYCYVVGLQILDPTYIGWLVGRFDPIQHYLGWDFFRRSDWTNPIGLSPTFGLDISSSIVYADSIPLMAIIFKGFDQLLPINFQYFGIWLLICFLLQAYFGWKLASIYLESALGRALITILFIVSPQLLWRLNTHAGVHNALASHFLILAGIFLSLRRDSSYRFLYWTILFTASLTINFYFLLITSFLWGADSLDRCLAKTLSARDFFKELLVLLILVLFFGWQVGYFAIATSSVDIWGYGFFRFNLMAPIDSYGLSTFMPNMSLPSTWGEGYSYFGLGVLAGLLFAAPYLFIRATSVRALISKRPALILVLILFFLLSVTNNVGIGYINFLIELPELALKILGITHSAARFFWPIYYFLIVFIVYAVQNLYSKKICLAIFFSIAALQLIDIYPLSRSIKYEYSRDLRGIYDSTILKNLLWNEIAQKYKKLIMIPAMNQPFSWENFAFFASKNGLATNSIFTARIDSSRVIEANKKLNNLIANGQLNSDAFYIVQDNFVLPILASADDDSPMLRLDGLNVFLPNWRSCEACTPLPINQELTIKNFRLKVGQEIFFSTKSDRSPFYLGSGWSWPESWGVWSDSTESIIYLPPPFEEFNGVNLKIQAFVVDEKKPEQAIAIYLDDGLVENKKIIFTDSATKTIQIPIEKKSNSRKIIKIKMVIDNPVSPRLLKIGNDDDRKLGIGLIEASFY